MKNTGAGAPAVNSVYSLYLNDTLSYHSTLRQMLLFWSLHFCLFSSTKSVPMYLVTCWKYKHSHIFISPCRNDPSQLQNCRTKRFLTVFETLPVTWRQRKEILSPTHPHTPKQSIFCLFFANSNISFGLTREALHRFNGCAKIWSAPGILVYSKINDQLDSVV